MRIVCLLALAGFVAGTLMSRVDPAFGRDQFKKAFDKKYVKTEPATDAEKELAAAVKTANCNICHVGAKPGKERNEYGKEFNKLIKTKDVANVEKMLAAFDEIASKKERPDDPTCPTYGELIAKGKLPCETPPAGSAAAPAK